MTTNSLKHTATKSGITLYGEKADIIVEIRLNDECKNGNQDFAITADIYKAGKRGDKNHISGGCCHDEILKAFPEFKIFVSLHLCDYKGIPMYAVENGFYHLTTGFNSTSVNDDGFSRQFCDYYRITQTQFSRIKESENALEYALLLKELGVLNQWQQEANEAIKLLETLTGNEFVVDSKKTQYHEPKEEDVQEFKKLKAEGYFSKDEKIKRANAKRIAEKEKLIDSIRESCNKEVTKARNERNVKLWCIERGIDINNMIYYTHSNTMSFNWKDYEKKMSESDFNKMCDGLKERDFQELPKGVTFELKGVRQFAKS